MEKTSTVQTRVEPSMPPVSPSSSSQENKSLNESVQRFRSLQELYKVTGKSR